MPDGIRYCDLQPECDEEATHRVDVTYSDDSTQSEYWCERHLDLGTESAENDPAVEGYEVTELDVPGVD